MGIYDKQPDVAVDAWVAPSASVIGEVRIASQSTVWYNCVVRADVNEIFIGGLTSVQDGTVITVAKTNPTGLPASTYIGNHVSIGPGCTLHSCTVEDEAVVGAGSVLLEGAMVEKQAQLVAGSVVEAGRRIPSGQLWAGNPAAYVRDITEDDIADAIKTVKEHKALAVEHSAEFLPLGGAYLDAEKQS